MRRSKIFHFKNAFKICNADSQQINFWTQGQPTQQSPSDKPGSQCINAFSKQQRKTQRWGCHLGLQTVGFLPGPRGKLRSGSSLFLGSRGSPCGGAPGAPRDTGLPLPPARAERPPTAAGGSAADLATGDRPLPSHQSRLDTRLRRQEPPPPPRRQPTRPARPRPLPPGGRRAPGGHRSCELATAPLRTARSSYRGVGSL